MAQLEMMLDDAARALASGDFAALGRLTPQIDPVKVASMDRPTAARVHVKALRNARMLEAAIRGVKLAQHRIFKITRGPVLVTYDANGQQVLLTQQEHELSRRA